MRLFVAIEIPHEIRNALVEFIQKLWVISPQAKWARADHLHVTLKFLGHTDDTNLAAIEKTLNSIRNPDPVTLSFRGLGFFPNEKRPRVFWAGMHASPNLKMIAGDIDQVVHKLGFPLEERAFTPHLTLARFDPPGIPPRLGAIISENRSPDFGAMTTREFHLIESKLKRTGSEYTTLRSFTFATET